MQKYINCRESLIIHRWWSQILIDNHSSWLFLINLGWLLYITVSHTDSMFIHLWRSTFRNFLSAPKYIQFMRHLIRLLCLYNVLPFSGSQYCLFCFCIFQIPLVRQCSAFLDICSSQSLVLFLKCGSHFQTLPGGTSRQNHPVLPVASCKD